MTVDDSTGMPGDAAFVPHHFCIHVTGDDAAQVVNNLTTNEVSKLNVGDACEAFITNVRGWVVAHAMIAKLEDRVILCGQHHAPAAICEHLERYIIREDADVRNLSDGYGLLAERNTGLFGEQPSQNKAGRFVFENEELTIMPALLGGDWRYIHFPKDVESELVDRCLALTNMASNFDLFRVPAALPLDQHEISEKTLPQELDRDAQAISFTKGCYLGQETVARLDARGQLQKKLCLLRIGVANAPAVGTPLFDGPIEVGRVTSVCELSDGILALAFVKRGAFDAGNTVTWADGDASILDPPA